jgi:hypothetical protein
VTRERIQRIVQQQQLVVGFRRRDLDWDCVGTDLFNAATMAQRLPPTGPGGEL